MGKQSYSAWATLDGTGVWNVHKPLHSLVVAKEGHSNSLRPIALVGRGTERDLYAFDFDKGGWKLRNRDDFQLEDRRLIFDFYTPVRVISGSLGELNNDVVSDGCLLASYSWDNDVRTYGDQRAFVEDDNFGEKWDQLSDNTWPIDGSSDRTESSSKFAIRTIDDKVVPLNLGYVDQRGYVQTAGMLTIAKPEATIDGAGNGGSESLKALHAKLQKYTTSLLISGSLAPRPLLAVHKPQIITGFVFSGTVAPDTRVLDIVVPRGTTQTVWRLDAGSAEKIEYVSPKRYGPQLSPPKALPPTTEQWYDGLVGATSTILHRYAAREAAPVAAELGATIERLAPIAPVRSRRAFNAALQAIIRGFEDMAFGSKSERDEFFEALRKQIRGAPAAEIVDVRTVIGTQSRCVPATHGAIGSVW